MVYDAPIPLTGWAALRRWLVCKMASHTSVCIASEVVHSSPQLTRYRRIAWCDDCGRPLKNGKP